MPTLEKYLQCLIVEDNPGDFILINEYLQEDTKKMVVNHATTFAAAKKLLTANIYSIILLDLSLPDASGEELVNGIVQLAGQAPVIVFTGYNDKNFGVKTLSLGISDYLFKDELNAAALYKSIAYSIERKRINFELNNSEEKYRNLFNLSPAPMWVFDPETLSFLSVNEAAIKHYGYTRKEFLKLTLKDLRFKEDQKALEASLADNMHKQSYSISPVRHIKKNGQACIVEIQGSTIDFNGKKARMVLVNDISTRHYQESILAFEKEIYKLNTSKGVSFEKVLKSVTTHMESMIPNSICSILQLKPENKIGNLVSPSLPPAYIKLIDGMPIGPTNGSCGTAMHTGNNVIVTDIEYDPLWKNYSDIAKSFGFKSCWSVPIKKSNGTVMGSFALYYKHVKAPQPEEINLIERAASLIGIIKENRDSIEAINFSNERFNVVAKATSDTIWDFNLQNDTITWNKGIQEMFGYSGITESSADWADNKIHPEDKERVIATVAKQIKEKQLRNQHEYRFLCADGSYKHIFDRSFLVIDAQGNPLKLIGAMQDVTRQKEEEQKLRLLESVITNSTDSILITEAEPIDEPGQQIIYVNEAFTKMTGYTKEEVLGRSPRFLQGPKSDRVQLDKMRAALENKEPCEIEIINYKKNGEEFWINVLVAPVFDKTGHHTHFIAIERDVTEKKKFDQELTKAIIHAQEKERSQIGSELHDNVNQILAGVQLSLGMAEKQKDLKDISEWIAKSRNYIQMAISENRKLSHRLAPAAFIENSIQDAFDSLLNSINIENKYMIDLHFENFNESYISGDIQLNLCRILQEQINNILKYSCADAISISIAQGNKFVRLRIADNGTGFDANTAKRGIGLNNIKKRTELFGGTFKLVTAPGKGCEIISDIPISGEVVNEQKKTRSSVRKLKAQL